MPAAEYIIPWPADAKIGVMRDRWSRLEDGRIQAHYTRAELALMLVTIGALPARIAQHVLEGQK